MADASTALSTPAARERISGRVLAFRGPGTAAQAFIAVSPAMKRVRELMQRAALSDLPVVIVGEASTGKELIARQIHAGGDRGSERFVAVDASFDPREAEAAVSASSTAARGTLFVAEIGAMSLPLQLKVLQSYGLPRESHRDDARLVATASLERSQRRKDDSSGSGRFRHELYRQRGAIIIDVPSLRERRADILPLARHFLAEARPGQSMTFAPAAERALEAYDWPDNIAELEGAVSEAALRTEGLEISAEAFFGLLHEGPDALAADMATMSYQEMLDAARARLARQYFSILLRETGGNVTHAARRAGLGRESLHRLLRQLGLSGQDFRRPTARSAQ